MGRVSDTALGAIIFAIGAVIIIGGFGLFFGGILWLGNSVTLAGNLVEIEQLRSDASHVDPAQAEDVIGQVTEWNQKIKSNQEYNHIWWAGWTIPDEWDKVQLIPVPRG